MATRVLAKVHLLMLYYRNVRLKGERVDREKEAPVVQRCSAPPGGPGVRGSTPTSSAEDQTLGGVRRLLQRRDGHQTASTPGGRQLISIQANSSVRQE